MKEIQTLLKSRQKFLLDTKHTTEEALKNAPEGYLRFSGSGAKTQYYVRKDPKDFNGTYIPNKDFSLAQAIAQKDYHQKLLRSIEKELYAIEKLFRLYPETNAEQLYQLLHPQRQKLITPIIESEQEFVKKWKDFQYPRKEFAEEIPKFYTEKGECVRSKSELMIANLLNRENIPYRYECPLHLKGLGKIHPDFTVLNVRLRKELYWEHLGMMDDPFYAENALRRINSYERNQLFPGERLILSHETRREPINQKILLQKIEHFLK